MKKVYIIVVSLALLASLAPPATADVGSRSHGRGAGGRHAPAHSTQFRGHSVPMRTHSFPRHHFQHHGFFPGHVAFGALFAPPVVVYSAPPAFYGPPSYLSAPVYAPPVVYTAPPYSHSTPPTPRVVEYPTGRYELRGDGVTTPYTWVWIPNPPPPPLSPPPPPSSSERPSSDVSPTRRTQTYRWVDGDGVVHLTNRLDAAPRP